MEGNQKIKLVQIIADGDLGGGPRHVLDLLKFIDKSKFECFLTCPSGNLAREARDLKGVEVIVTIMRSKFDFIAVFKMNQILSEIQSRHDPFGPMIVHTHGPRAGMLGRWATPRGVRSVYTEHRWDADYHLENRLNEWLQLYFLKNLNRRTDLIIAVSNAVKDFLVTRNLALEGRVSVIPNGIDLKKPKTSNQKPKSKKGNTYIIGSIGNLNHQKGQIFLIEAMPEIIKAYPHAMLEIIGEGPERENLEFKIQNLKLERHVTLLGRQENPEQFMAKWSLFVLPSIAETFGIVILEAFQANLPVIATNVGGIGDIVKDKKNGILVGKENPGALAQAAIEVWSRPAMAENISRKGLESLKHYDWEHVVNKIETQYERIIRS